MTRERGEAGSKLTAGFDIKKNYKRDKWIMY
jgi:hypothetical protein